MSTADLLFYGPGAVSRARVEASKSFPLHGPLDFDRDTADALRKLKLTAAQAGDVAERLTRSDALEAFMVGENRATVCYKAMGNKAADVDLLVDLLGRAHNMSNPAVPAALDQVSRRGSLEQVQRLDMGYYRHLPTAMYAHQLRTTPGSPSDHRLHPHTELAYGEASPEDMLTIANANVHDRQLTVTGGADDPTWVAAVREHLEYRLEMGAPPHNIITGAWWGKALRNGVERLHLAGRGLGLPEIKEWSVVQPLNGEELQEVVDRGLPGENAPLEHILLVEASESVFEYVCSSDFRKDASAPWMLRDLAAVVHERWGDPAEALAKVLGSPRPDIHVDTWMFFMNAINLRPSHYLPVGPILGEVLKEQVLRGWKTMGVGIQVDYPIVPDDGPAADLRPYIEAAEQEFLEHVDLNDLTEVQVGNFSCRSRPLAETLMRRIQEAHAQGHDVQIPSPWLVQALGHPAGALQDSLDKYGKETLTYALQRSGPTILKDVPGLWNQYAHCADLFEWKDLLEVEGLDVAEEILPYWLENCPGLAELVTLAAAQRPNLLTPAIKSGALRGSALTALAESTLPGRKDLANVLAEHLGDSVTQWNLAAKLLEDWEGTLADVAAVAKPLNEN